MKRHCKSTDLRRLVVVHSLLFEFQRVQRRRGGGQLRAHGSVVGVRDQGLCGRGVTVQLLRVCERLHRAELLRGEALHLGDVVLELG